MTITRFYYSIPTLPHQSKYQALREVALASVGYGTAFGGISALLSMLNSCASGVFVVNIDNVFGAGYLASRINHIGGQSKISVSLAPSGASAKHGGIYENSVP